MSINGRNGLPQPFGKPQLILLQSLSLTAEQSFFACKFLDRRRALCFLCARDAVEPGIVPGIHRLSGCVRLLV
ncbi:hypothetical protein [Sutterella wadsworthensis]|uniref:hypothetical protein n=1 Tax=Sutterella wadsworthensis TaxID=40545 RepID=UPI003A94E711